MDKLYSVLVDTGAGYMVTWKRLARDAAAALESARDAVEHEYAFGRVAKVWRDYEPGEPGYWPDRVEQIDGD